MKKQISIWMLYAGSTVNKLLMLLAALAAGETALFYRAMQASAARTAGDAWNGIHEGIETVMKDSAIPLVCFAVFAVWLLVLTVPSHGKAAATLERLQLTRKNIYFIHIAYNTLSVLVFWGAQVLIMTALLRWYGVTAPEENFGPQTVLLAFYRDDFLHSLLPLLDWTRYLRNLALALAFGCGTAGASLYLRKSHLGYVLLAGMCGVLFFFFPGEPARLGADAGLSLVLLALGAGMAVSVWKDLAEGRERA